MIIYTPNCLILSKFTSLLHIEGHMMSNEITIAIQRNLITLLSIFTLSTSLFAQGDYSILDAYKNKEYRYVIDLDSDNNSDSLEYLKFVGELQIITKSESILADLSVLKSMRRLSLRIPNVTRIPSSIFEMESIETLNIESDSLHYLSDSIAYLPKYFSYNTTFK